MRIAIMQPYLFPYLGYYQLMNAVDAFIIYDDINFIKKGWINRNRILLNNADFMFTIILNGASQNKKINEIQVGGNNHKLITTIENAYRKAPYFNEVYPLITNILLYPETNLAKYVTNSLKATNRYLGINVPIIFSSEIEKDTFLKGDDKIIDICKRLKASTYINAIGGKELYSKQKFVENGLILKFIKSNPIIYPQFTNIFVPWLSIIDIMMFNDIEQVHSMLNNYELQ